MQHFLVFSNDKQNYINAYGLPIDKFCQPYVTLFLKNSFSSSVCSYITIMFYLAPSSVII